MNKNLIIAACAAATGIAAVATVAINPSATASIGYSSTMNGHGIGDLTFTNTGDKPGALCGRIVIDGPKDAIELGAIRCSGEVAPQTTVTRTFTELGVSDMCEPKIGQKSWQDNCSFYFDTDAVPPTTPVWQNF